MDQILHLRYPPQRVNKNHLQFSFLHAQAHLECHNMSQLHHFDMLHLIFHSRNQIDSLKSRLSLVNWDLRNYLLHNLQTFRRVAHLVLELSFSCLPMSCAMLNKTLRPIIIRILTPQLRKTQANPLEFLINIIPKHMCLVVNYKVLKLQENFQELDNIIL